VIRSGTRAPIEWRLEIPFLATLVVLLVFMGLSVANYVSVAQVHGSARVEATASIGYIGLDSNGTLPRNGTARAWINVTVANPTSRSLQYDTVIYKIWMEDLPREAGFAVVRKDVPVQNGSVIRWLYLAYSGSNTSSGVSVPAFGAGTVPLVLDLTEGLDPYTFAAVQNITGFAVSQGRSLTTIPLELFILTSLFIDGAPQPQSPTAALYLTDVVRIVLGQGTDYGA